MDSPKRTPRDKKDGNGKWFARFSDAYLANPELEVDFHAEDRRPRHSEY